MKVKMNVSFYNSSSTKVVEDEYLVQLLGSTSSIPLFNFDINQMVTKRCCNIVDDFVRKFESFIIIGMGGASLNVRFLLTSRQANNVVILDDLDPINIDNKIKSLDLKNTGVIAISKSGYTSEVIAIVNYVNNFFVANQLKINNKILAVTKENSRLYSLIESFGGKIIHHRQDVNGRFSSFSMIGYLICSLLDISFESLISLSKYYYNQYVFFKNDYWQQTMSFISISCHQVMMSYGTSSNIAAAWLAQIMSESSGKNHKGITPILSHAPQDHHSHLQLYLGGQSDKNYTLLFSSYLKQDLKMTALLKQEFNIALNLFCYEGIPVRSVEFNSFDESSFAEFYISSILECLLYCWIIGVNPFSQKNVDMIKYYHREVV